MKLRADLHLHTYYSDGRQSPGELISAAAREGVELLALTDHDTMLGCDETEKLAKAANIVFARGLEVSAYAGEIKLHTLAYGVDEGKFGGFLDALYLGSVKRAEDIIFKLNACGVRLTLEEAAAERFSESSPIHGMHIARAAAKKGYAPTAFAFYVEYMGTGKPAFSCVGRPSPEDTCAAIAAAGGFSAVAHPGRVEMPPSEFEKLVLKMKDCGLDGIEVYYTTHTTEQTAYYRRLAERLMLIPTGGSDTHWNGGGNRIGQPVFFADEKLFTRLNVDKNIR